MLVTFRDGQRFSQNSGTISFCPLWFFWVIIVVTASCHGAGEFGTHSQQGYKESRGCLAIPPALRLDAAGFIITAGLDGARQPRVMADSVPRSNAGLLENGLPIHPGMTLSPARFPGQVDTLIMDP